MQTVLFLCTGNYYRSRFAEIYFNWHAAKQQIAWRADSRGLAIDARNLGHMSHYTIRHLANLEIPVDECLRFPQDLCASDLRLADHVVAVKESEHRPLMTTRFPQWLDKVEFWEVHDIDCADPEQALPHLEREVTALIRRLKSRTSVPRAAVGLA